VDWKPKRKNPKMENKTEGENGNNRMGNGRREKLRNMETPKRRNFSKCPRTKSKS
jgi:hypothetical protein